MDQQFIELYSVPVEARRMYAALEARHSLSRSELCIPLPARPPSLPPSLSLPSDDSPVVTDTRELSSVAVRPRSHTHHLSDLSSISAAATLLAPKLSQVPQSATDGFSENSPLSSGVALPAEGSSGSLRGPAKTDDRDGEQHLGDNDTGEPEGMLYGGYHRPRSRSRQRSGSGHGQQRWM